MRKSIYLLISVFTILSCNNKLYKDYVTLSGNIQNPNSDSLIIAQRTIIKTIKVGSDGTFKDTLKVEPGNYALFDGREQASLYLKNGYDLHIDLDAKQFDETLKFKGTGNEANNYLVEKSLLIEKMVDYDKITSLEESQFYLKLEEIARSLNDLLAKTKDLDSVFVASQKKETLGLKSQLSKMHEKKKTLAALKGQTSPKFVDYENHEGNKVSLEDLKGKYVYIDIWATWCGPCKREIPYLKEIEKKYHNRNIEFVSISVDADKDRDKWKKMIEDKELGGIQLFADNNWKSSFIKDYAITGIPRFILIDPNSKIISADAPRPSDKKLIDLFNELNM